MARAQRPEGLLDGVPRALPALMQAQKVSRKAAACGFEWETVADVWDKVAEERAEFEAEAPGSAEREMEFGDLLFALVNVARKEGIDAESALRASTAKFRERWAAMENAAYEGGVARGGLLRLSSSIRCGIEVKRGNADLKALPHVGEAQAGERQRAPEAGVEHRDEPLGGEAERADRNAARHHDRHDDKGRNIEELEEELALLAHTPAMRVVCA
ncbi:MAG: hypothetical protein ACLTSX_05470 [Collinsella sp.]